MEYVYFFRETGRPYVKIGMSKNEIETRFQAFKTYAPLGAYIVGYIKTINSAKIEKLLHEKYKDKRLHGEFFNLSDDEVYAEINKHDSKFGEIIYLVDQLINFHDCDINEVKTLLIENIKKRKEVEDKYKPEDILYNYIKSKKGSFMTNTMILDELSSLGFIISQYKLGVTLKKMGYKQKPKRIGDIVSKVYIL